MSDDAITLETATARALVHSRGALLTAARLKLGDGRWVTPLAEAPWAGEPQPPEVPGHLLRLGGEFFCLPFGGGGPAHDVSPGYEAMFTGPFEEPLHGPAANADWRLAARAHNSVTLTLELGEAYAVRRIERTIALAEDRPEIRFDVRIDARRAGRVPAAFHPILRLPERTGDLRLDAAFDAGFTYPAVHAHRRTLAAPGHRFARLDAVPGHDGRGVDFTALPPGAAVEDNILLAGARGPVAAHFADEAFRLTVDWDRMHLPHVMLWLQDRATVEPPWGGRYRGLGVEPMAACFDGPWGFSTGDNPLARAGFATALDVDPARATEVWCTLRAESTA